MATSLVGSDEHLTELEHLRDTLRTALANVEQTIATLRGLRALTEAVEAWAADRPAGNGAPHELRQGAQVRTTVGRATVTGEVVNMGDPEDAVAEVRYVDSNGHLSTIHRRKDKLEVVS